MKKVYNYRNTTNINCEVDKCPVGFSLDKYRSEINQKRHEQRKEPILKDNWICSTDSDVGDYYLNISFENKKLLFSVNGSGKVDPSITVGVQWYYHILDETLLNYRTKSYEYSGLFFTNSKLRTAKGKKLLVPVKITQLDFKVDIEDITSMEVIRKWLSNYIYIKLNFSKVLKHDVSNITLKFHKSDEQDFKFVVDEINTIRRIIQSKEQRTIIERWEKENDEPENGERS